MAFIRDLKRGNKIYRYEVESYREKGKVKQRAKYLGKIEKTGNAETVIPPKELILRTAISEVRSYGLLDVLYQMAKEWELVETVEETSDVAKKNGYGEAILLLALNHITGRCALDRVAEWYRRSVLYPHLGTTDLFTKKRLLDAMDSLVYEDEYENLFDYTMQLSQKFYEASTKLIERSNSGLIYDITEIASYSENNVYASLGYSPTNENNKLAKVCLITDRSTKLPVLLFINNGKLPDKSTVSEMLNRLKIVGIDNKKSRIIFDRGIVSEENIKMHKDAGLDVIAGLTMRRKDVEDLVSDIDEKEFLRHYNAVKRADGIAYLVERDFEFGGVNGKAIICLVPKLQDNVRTARMMDVQEAIACLDDKNKSKWHKIPKDDIQRLAESIIAPVKKFVRIKVDDTDRVVTYKIDDALLDKETNKDGRFAIFSTDAKLSKKDVFEAYFSRDIVEKAFRTYKGELNLPPLRHWKRKRLISYLQICFLSYLLQSYLMYKARAANLKDGWTELKFVLNEIQQVVVASPLRESTIYVNITPKHKMILGKLGYNLM